jgi:hypothetical protein
MNCVICRNEIRELINMPQFPMTELYEQWTPEFAPRGFVDQAFMFCPTCSHGQLKKIIPAQELYSNYRTQTWRSVGASHSVSAFHDFINNAVSVSGFDKVIDIGANDCSLLQFFPLGKRIAIDPNANGDAQLIKSYVEGADLMQFKAQKKLFACSHTLEHLANPGILFGKLFECMTSDDACAFQFPSLDCMVKDARIDQIHHQHVHYFSLHSISKLLKQYNFRITHHIFDANHYGTLRIIFRRDGGEVIGDAVDQAKIYKAADDFHREMDAFGAAINRLDAPVGYGASLMYPVLAHHAPELKRVLQIMDADTSKHGQRWINVNTLIIPERRDRIEGRDFVVCAFNTKLAVRKIAAQLFEKGARNVAVPFHTL